MQRRALRQVQQARNGPELGERHVGSTPGMKTRKGDLADSVSPTPRREILGEIDLTFQMGVGDFKTTIGAAWTFAPFALFLYSDHRCRDG